MSILTTAPFSFQIATVLFFGLTLGSFANVCIHRLPKNESVVSTFSYCPSCKAKVAAWDNIPVFSYLLLRGKCRQCTTPISILYPVIEVITAFLILFGFIKFGISWKFAIFCILGPALVIISAVDIKHKIIPDIITLPGILFGLIAGGYLIGLKDALIGLLVGGGIFLTISEAYYRARGIVGMGGGDIKFISAAGALLGWQQVILVIFISAFAGSLFGLAGLASKRTGGLREIPFGPFLAAGTIAAYFSGEHIIHLYTMMITAGY